MADAKRNLRIGRSPNFGMCNYRIFPTSSIIFKIDSGLAISAGSWNIFSNFQVVKYHTYNTYNKRVISLFDKNHSVLPESYISNDSHRTFKSGDERLKIQRTCSQRLSLYSDSLDLASNAFGNQIGGFHQVQTCTLTPLNTRLDEGRFLKSRHFAINSFIMEEVSVTIQLPGYYRNWAYNNYVFKQKDVDIKTGSFNYNEPVLCLLDEGIGTIQYNEDKKLKIKYFNLLDKTKEILSKSINKKFHSTEKIKLILCVSENKLVELSHIFINNNYLSINYIFGWMTPYSCALVNLKLSFNQVN